MAEDTAKQDVISMDARARALIGDLVKRSASARYVRIHVGHG